MPMHRETEYAVELKIKVRESERKIKKQEKAERLKRDRKSVV
jgi:hypothetical protein